MKIQPFSLDFSASTNMAELFFNADEKPGPRCFISTRQAGSLRYGPGDEARAAFFRSLGLEPQAVYSCVQRHTRLAALARPEGPRRLEADGLLSHPGQALSVTVADCVPIFLWDTGTGAYGILHSGWKGTGIAVNALCLMQSAFGTRPEDAAAIIGPCIRGCCYRVDGERAAAFEREFGGAGEFPLGPVVRRQGGDAFLDMQAANAALLARAGVQRLAWCEDCTFTDERLGSYRREGEAYTSMAALIFA
jgi:YfiH family protein